MGDQIGRINSQVLELITWLVIINWFDVCYMLNACVCVVPLAQMHKENYIITDPYARYHWSVEFPLIILLNTERTK